MNLRKILFYFSIFFLVAIMNGGIAQQKLQTPEKSDPPEVWQQWRSKRLMLRKQLIGDHDWRKEGIHNGNQVSTVFYNYGTIGQPGNTAQPG